MTEYRKIFLDHNTHHGAYDAYMVMIHDPGSERTTICLKSDYGEGRPMFFSMTRKERREMVEVLLACMETDGEL